MDEALAELNNVRRRIFEALHQLSDAEEAGGFKLPDLRDHLMGAIQCANKEIELLEEEIELHNEEI